MTDSTPLTEAQLDEMLPPDVTTTLDTELGTATTPTTAEDPVELSPFQLESLINRVTARVHRKPELSLGDPEHVAVVGPVQDIFLRTEGI